MYEILKNEFKNYSQIEQDIRETLGLYELYKGTGQNWNNLDEKDYEHIRKISN